MSTSSIMLVDDSKLFIALEKEFLKQFEGEIHTADNGLEALEKARKVKPDLIFMDVNMPEMDGATCCSIIKSDEELKAIPIILVTSGRGNDKELAENVECEGYLTKPIDRKAFLEIGRRYLPGIDRRSERVPCSITVRFKVNNEIFEGMCHDMSKQGVYISFSGRELKPDDRLEMAFIYSNTPLDKIEVYGRIAWVNTGSILSKPTLPTGFGVEFLATTQESLKLIEEFLKKND